MFERIEMAPPDAILGLTEAFIKDPRPGKINLGVGEYKDEQGATPIFASVKRAEERLLKQETTKTYLPISGDPGYGSAVRQLVFGGGHEAIESKRAVTAHTTGGTGGLRVAADFLKKMAPGARVWVSEPTWPNHPAVFKAAGLEVMAYPYYDGARKCLAFDQMMAALENVPESDVVLFQAACHNPTGMDPDAAQWGAIAEVIERRGFLPFFDFAYQGLGDGLEEDAAGVRACCRPGRELLVVSSFSKNFGLYNERVGALTLVAGNEEAAQRSFSQIKICVRTCYSNPPAHGAAIVTTILGETGLRKLWESEVTAMRDRINGMRRLFVETLKTKGVKQDFSFIIRQKGMFSFSGLTKAQVDALRDRYGMYVVGSGRINVAGMTPQNMDALCQAITEVL